MTMPPAAKKLGIVPIPAVVPIILDWVECRNSILSRSPERSFPLENTPNIELNLVCLGAGRGTWWAQI